MLGEGWWGGWGSGREEGGLCMRRSTCVRNLEAWAVFYVSSLPGIVCAG